MLRPATKVYRFGFVLLFMAVFFTLPAQAATGLNAMRALAAEGYDVAGLVVNLSSGERVAEYNADQLLSPASVTKLYTAAKALEVWGADYRFETDVLVQGQRRGPTIDGNLVLRGGGDPSFTNSGLWRLALDVAQSGIQEVSGDLIVDESRFGRVTCVTHDRCKAEKKSWHSYDSLLSSTAVNHGNIAVVVSPGESIGAPAHISIDPYPLPTMDVRGSINTVKGYGAQFSVSRFTENGSDWLKVSGTIGVKAGTHRVYRSVGQPARYTGNLFREFLQAAGVKVGGKVEVSLLPETGDRLSSYQGEPLNQILGDMLYYSNNLIADVLTLNIRAERNPLAPVNLTIAGGELQSYARERTRASAFANSSDAILHDGSGLNPDNRLAPVDLVALLDGVYQRTRDFPYLLGALRVPAQSPSRGLSGSNEIWDRLSVKTGGLSEPVSVHTLAGYLRFKNGDWGAFAMMVNGTRANRWIPRVKAFEAMRKDLEKL
ncbi:D-alanyl-D-alanine carboxypeptidase/D-alanyl-D-alanine-endopeptidase (penicillin-binding protein 4) [Methylohalomonas lacus]|uniref:D-alanyl-D-alanine carboxypeptidase/D-alanyl-D-alanine-endopeptidase (Penicillin-binding protein 4) n=1 Tax=Methylohalomonas lacus TaxID=398773 RepID=A0AAE3HKL7_9GAMM|nr:D-alanyl-D-alanine carboxypeptidase/D-alanyl-D-alanine-endopeptidase [Methylohalomonas lacus]MCS3902677.1 D-alanyl-D-alanine carboxypeptidase/D-alanyl-D-alanine-endopeptidase (penicillin-binding protein 4) [Methylohalomonas lacus]